MKIEIRKKYFAKTDGEKEYGIREWKSFLRLEFRESYVVKA